MSPDDNQFHDPQNEIDYANAPILIIDDDDESILLLKFILQKAGYSEIHHTTDPRTAANRYREVRPHIVLLDIHMPFMDGFEVLEQLKAIEGDNYVPALVLTASNEIDIRHKALESGARDFINKPFDSKEALNRIRNLIEVRWLYERTKAHNELLDSLVKARTHELEDTRLDIIYRLGRAAEYRDTDTGQHVIRISEYSAALARAMGFDDEWCELLKNASPMHDIGKIGIPDAILCKPDSLSVSEYDTMKLHTTIGASILAHSDSPLMKLSHEIALMHHEKWDGTGYPLGLSKDKIPIHCRIVSIVDVFDALTTERPYKEPWAADDAIDMIVSQSGKSFDPAIVKHFMMILPEILAIHESHTDSSSSSSEDTVVH